MQRYRVNYHLLIGLGVGSLVVAVAAYFLWSWQVSRKATWFKEDAKLLQAEGKKEEAFDQLFKYVQFRPDEDEARIELARIGLEILQDRDTSRESKGEAYFVLQEAVRRTGDPGLRLELAKFIIHDRPQDALVHINELLRDRPDDSELLEMQAQAVSRTRTKKEAMDLCFRLVGYDKSSETFDPSKASAKDRPDVYALLAGLIIENDRDDKELAKQVVDQMIEQNPESAKAYLNKSVFLRSINEKEEAQEALAKAFELGPDDLDVLRQKGFVEFQDDEYELAEETLRGAIEKFPDSLILYDLLSRVLMQQKEMGKALAVLEQGEKQLGDSQRLAFSQLRLNILFIQEDYDAVKKELKRLDALQMPALAPYIRFNRARILWQQGEWNEAARELSAVRASLIDFPQEQAMAGFMLASCYERQGKLDLAKVVYQEVREKFPKYEPAQRGLDLVLRKLGISDDQQGMDLDKAIDEMAALPPEQQDWGKIDERLDKVAKARDFSEARLKLIQAEIMIRREKFKDARDLIKEAAALEPDNIDVYYAAIALLMKEPKSGAAVALKRLEMLKEKFGDSARARVTQAGILHELNPPDVVEQMEALSTGMDDWSPEQRGQVEAAIALRLEQLGNIETAKKHWQISTSLVSDSLPVYMHMFEIAFRNRDFEAMREAEQNVLNVVKDEKDGSYVLCVVRRLMLEYTQQRIEREELVAGRKMLEEALKRRSEWADLHILYGQVLLVLEEDVDLALRHLDEALKYGPANANALSLQVKILAQRGEFNEARKKMDLIAKSTRLDVLGRVEAEVLLQTNDPDAAFESARELADKESDSSATQLWFAEVATRTEHLEEAAKALSLATELRPRDADNWLKLIATLAQLKDDAAIEKALHEAQLAIDADMLPLFTAKKYELMGDWQSAEKIYLGAFGSRLDELPILQRMAEFYLLWAKSGKLSAQRAAPYINRILRQAYEEEVEWNNPVVAWAQDKAVRFLASSGDYQDFLKAVKILNPHDDPSQLTVPERGLLAEILSNRGEPASQLQAKRILSDMNRNGEISKQGILALSKLLMKAGEWESGQKLLLDAITKYGDDEQIWATFVDLLIERGEYSTASVRLERLKDLNPKSPYYTSLSIKLAAESGNQAKLQKLLQKLLPDLGGAMKKDELDRVLSVARMATENRQYELANKLYDLYVSRVPGAMVEYTNFLARHGDCQQAVSLMKEQFPEKMDQMLQIAVTMLRERREEIGDTFDADIEEFVARALRDDPEAVQRLLFQAQLYEIEGKYEESVAAYDRILARDDIPRTLRAAAMNNLGFLLGLLQIRTDEAEHLIDQAIQIYGPSSDILDTRAIIRMVRKNYDGAVEDITLATALSDDPVKFFHSARANMLAGNIQPALKAWDRALELGISKEKLPVTEKPEFDGIRGQIEELRTQSAGL